VLNCYVAIHVTNNSHRFAWLTICSRVEKILNLSSTPPFPCILPNIRLFSSSAYFVLRIGFNANVSPQPDAESSICDEPSCTRYFSYFTRRHHCRRCGNIFCDLHSMYSIPLDQEANYHPKGYRSRSCEHCWGEYRAWQIARSSRSNSDTSEGQPATPTVNCHGNAARQALAGELSQKQGIVGSLAASVPRDWNWSTF
jgi:hypothetical protein